MPIEVGKQLMSAPDVPAEVRVDHAKRFSWKAFGQAYEAELIRIAQRGSASSIELKFS